MKKTLLISGCMLFSFVILLPLGVVLSSCFGYTFELTNYLLFTIMTAFLSVSVVILYFIAGKTVDNRIVTVLFALLIPLSLINVVFYMFKCSGIWIAASLFTCVVCCCYLTVKYGRPWLLKIIALILSVLMVFPVVFFGFIPLIFGDMGQNTVVQSVESPGGAYYAEVVDSNQGAFGGDTFVDVYENKEFNAFVFKISKNPKRVYSGAWGAFEDMEIYWKDENCLVINSVEHIIK